MQINLAPLVLSFVGYATIPSAATVLASSSEGKPGQEEQRHHEEGHDSSVTVPLGGEGGREAGLVPPLPLQLMNVGMILDSQAEFREALAPLRGVVEASERESTTSGRGLQI